MKYSRTKGGEKNEKSGVRWNEEELKQVLKLYLKLNGKAIHENNKLIQKLAIILGRTTRSVEAQLLMFKNLDKHGDYSYRNMSRTSIRVWNNYLKKF